MCLRTWGSHSVDDLLVIDHQQVPLLRLRRRGAPRRSIGVRVPQIRLAFPSIAITESIQARLLHSHSWGSCWRPRIAAKGAKTIRV